jgi:hypothetical protein
MTVQRVRRRHDSAARAIRCGRAGEHLGRVANSSDADDWGYMLRAQYARITGPLYLSSRHRDQFESVRRSYRVEVLSKAVTHADQTAHRA